MKLRIESEKMESESGLLAECPARRQRHTNEKLVPLNRGLDELRKGENENGEGTIILLLLYLSHNTNTL